MLKITTPHVGELELKVGYLLTCTSCTNTLFIESGSDIGATVTARRWQQAETEHEHRPCLCPTCVTELKEIEAELQQSNRAGDSTIGENP
ncbi:hypothetical protein MJ923_07750 [Shewanella sp. 3B26]|uniref:Uncharacterized protein n=1 Tax=Shewanella zhuhaiensis TaxID=2919576 RepID=A0AAJ1BHV3_9GAMM|nr:hypothetical protein [Shewanella zhuhaiensis]MCH4294197.1 hypothetical protein [Shewanella zhuhaiensis]